MNVTTEDNPIDQIMEIIIEHGFGCHRTPMVQIRNFTTSGYRTDIYETCPMEKHKTSIYRTDPFPKELKQTLQLNASEID